MRECSQSECEVTAGCPTAPVVVEPGEVGDHQHSKVGSGELRNSERGLAGPGCPTVPGAAENPTQSAKKVEFRVMPR